jgi:AraC-like DNA-binding protein
MQLRQRLASLDGIDSALPTTVSELDLKLMSEMRGIIEAHIDDCEFTVHTLAYELRVSRTTLYNKIKGLTGGNPSDLIRTYRINRAKVLLREHRYTVAEVTDRVGFADQKYFREIFKKAVGMTPSEYARSNDTVLG